MPRGQQPEASFGEKLKDTFYLTWWAADAGAMCVLPFIRHGMGKRGIGTAGGLALLIMFTTCGLTGSVAMLLYIKAWLIFAIYRRLRADRAQHTGFQGWSLIDGRVRSRRAARVIEALLVLAIGLWLSDWSPDIGRFVTTCSAALGIKAVLESAAFERQDEAAHNAIVQMELMQARMNEVKHQR